MKKCVSKLVHVYSHPNLRHNMEALLPQLRVTLAIILFTETGHLQRHLLGETLAQRELHRRQVLWRLTFLPTSPKKGHALLLLNHLLYGRHLHQSNKTGATYSKDGVGALTTPIKARARARAKTRNLMFLMATLVKGKSHLQLVEGLLAGAGMVEDGT